MQPLRIFTGKAGISAVSRCAAALALCLMLGACQAPPTPTAPAAAMAPAATSSTGATAPDGGPPPATAAETRQGEAQDGASSDAPLQPQYTRCVQDARGMTDELLACGEAEFAHHKALLEQEVARLMGGPDGLAKDRWMDEQAQWAEQTDTRCHGDPETSGQGQQLDAQLCRINRYANRAVELKARTLLP